MMARPDERQLAVDVEHRFWPKVQKSDGCWIWNGTIGQRGYGQLSSQRYGRTPTTLQAHRVAYVLTVGPIPAGLQIDHLCRIKSCVNPAHLEPVTASENVRRGYLARPARTQCRVRHPLSDSNLYVYRGRRLCRVCGRTRHTAWRRRRREAAAA